MRLRKPCQFEILKDLISLDLISLFWTVATTINLSINIHYGFAIHKCSFIGWKFQMSINKAEYKNGCVFFQLDFVAQIIYPRIYETFLNHSKIVLAGKWQIIEKMKLQDLLFDIEIWNQNGFKVFVFMITEHINLKTPKQMFWKQFPPLSVNMLQNF